MKDWLEILNIIGGLLVLGFIVSSFWWNYGASVFVGIACAFALMNFLVNDYRKEVRLKYLEEKCRKDKLNEGNKK